MNNSDMPKPNRPMPNRNDHAQRTLTPQAKKRAWVTPVFEQVALKDSLNGTGDYLPDDLITLAS